MEPELKVEEWVVSFKKNPKVKTYQSPLWYSFALGSVIGAASTTPTNAATVAAEMKMSEKCIVYSICGGLGFSERMDMVK